MSTRNGFSPSLHRRLAILVLTALAATAIAPAAAALFSFIGASRYRADSAHAQAMPSPFPNCSPLGGRVPAGQANPSAEPEPMGPVWCFPLTNSPTTRISGPNDWIDNFNTNVQMGHLNDHEMGYRVMDAFNANPGFFKSGSFVNNNHWMIDLGNTTQFNLSGGVMLSPDRSFRAENGKLVVEFDVAASTDAMGGADQFVEFDLTSAPNMTGATVDTLYGYGVFGGVGAVGCRLESGANFVCAMYDNSTRATDGRDVLGGPEGESGRVWETQGVGNRLTAESIVGGTPEHVVAPGLRLRDVWRACNPNQMDMFCRDRFRFEITKTSIHIFVNAFPAMQIDGLFASNPEGRDSRIPDQFLNNARVYLASWVNGGVAQPLTRWHWGRIAVNPHNIGGVLMPPSAAPSFCLGQPQNTCPMNMDLGPTMTPMPSMTPMPTMPSPTATGTPATVTSTPEPSATTTAATPTMTQIIAGSSPIPTPTKMSTPSKPTPVPSSFDREILSFDNLGRGGLNFRYPAGLIDWGTNAWQVWGPSGRLSTNSVKFASFSMRSATFSFVTPKRLTSFVAYNQANTPGVLTVSCPGQSTKQVTLLADEVATIALDWSGRCATVSVSSTVGWYMHFDNLVVYDS